VALGSSAPPFYSGNYALEVFGRPAPERAAIHDVSRLSIDPGYLRILRVRLRRGREFDRRDRSGAPRVAIVNDALVREYFPATDPVGQRIRIAADPAGDWATIVGVAASVKTTTVFREMGWAEAPAVYFPLAQVTPPTAALLVRGAGVGRRQIEDALRTLDPGAVVGYFESVDTSMAKLLAYPRFRAVVLGGFALFALALAGTGLYAVLS
jgi:hypothetical protein